MSEHKAMAYEIMHETLDAIAKHCLDLSTGTLARRTLETVAEMEREQVTVRFRYEKATREFLAAHGVTKGGGA